DYYCCAYRTGSTFVF
nr:immunoglobulin light chain junction region [Macaca mulatta]MOX17303.1 immunoglobulin light chain junction region [Macaca mulatta]MOX17320.1 immunoglobulin light chain junction region [Macaca mulatta]MOX17929.1 immunoglobulin light chain junction region [Macaca mulatta]MOX21017.1 immunoglobulin light chain junction region [Macaca mulatta]